jgi:hypothetical protein
LIGPRRFVARSRRRAARLAWRAALGPISGELKHAGSLWRQWPPAVAAHLESAVVVDEATVERYDDGRSLPPRFRASRAFDDRYLYRLRNVCVSPWTGLSWLPGGPILRESAGSLDNMIEDQRWMLEEPLMRPRRTIEGPVTVAPPVSYYHWVLEVLPRLLRSLAAEPAATVVVPRRMPRYAEESMALLELPRIARSDEPVLAESLVFVSWDSRGMARRSDVELIRETLRPYAVRPAEPSERVYVSRRFSRRTPVNEDELERLAERHGFRVVYAERLSFAEQISLFSGARVFAGPHGAGLTNMVFAGEPERLLELFAVDFHHDCYARLSAQLGAGYAWFSCTGGSQEQSVAPLEVLEETFAALDA